MSKTIAILTSGGDSPGMNAAIRAATLVAVAKGHRMLGVRQGYRGLLEGKLVPIGADEVNDILRNGGTFLHSARCWRESIGRWCLGSRRWISPTVLRPSMISRTCFCYE